jgi:hypothetical protein
MYKPYLFFQSMQNLWYSIKWHKSWCPKLNSTSFGVLVIGKCCHFWSINPNETTGQFCIWYRPPHQHSHIICTIRLYHSSTSNWILSKVGEMCTWKIGRLKLSTLKQIIFLNKNNYKNDIYTIYNHVYIYKTKYIFF